MILHKNLINKKTIIYYLGFCIIFLIFLFFMTHRTDSILIPYTNIHNIAPDDTLIVLSPHLDDAVMSLGGFLVSYPKRAIVATFFTKSTNEVVKTYWNGISGFINSHEAINQRIQENSNALSDLALIVENFTYDDVQYRKEDNVNEIKGGIVKDIKMLLLKYTNNRVFIYGPAIFSSDIVNPDHEILHNAFLEVAESYASRDNFSFFIYEDVPYTEKFIKNQNLSLLELIQMKDEIIISPEVIPLTLTLVDLKLNAFKQYFSQIKAFNALNEDIIAKVQHFVLYRSVLGPAEIVYRIVP